MTKAEALKIYQSVNALSEWQTREKSEMWIAILISPQQSDVLFEDARTAVMQLVTEHEPRKIYPALVLMRAREIFKARDAKARSWLPPPEDESGRAERPIYFPPDNGKEQFPVAHPDEAERERMRFVYARAPLPATIVNRRDLGIRHEHIEAAREWRAGEIKKLEEGLAAMKGREEALLPEERGILRDAERRLDQLQRQQRKEAPGIRPMFAPLLKSLTNLGVAMKLHCEGCRKELDRDEINAATARLMEAGRRGEKEGHTYCPSCSGNGVPF